MAELSKHCLDGSNEEASERLQQLIKELEEEKQKNKAD